MRTEDVGLTRKSTGLNTENNTIGKMLRGVLLATVFMGWAVSTSVQAQLINVVTATSSTNDPTPANNGGVGSPTLPPVDSGVVGGVAENNRTATTINPTISKAFNTVYIGLGGTTTLTFTITNPNAVPITAATLTDTLPIVPGAMVVATPPAIVNTTCNFAGGLPVAGAATLSLTGGTIPANSSCTFSVNVTAPVVGVYNNTAFDTTGSVIPFTGANPVAVDAPTPAPAALVVLEPIKSVILQTDTGVVGPSAGDTLRYLITYTLPAGVPAIPNFQITDILPTPNGLTFVGGSLVVTGGTPNGAFNGTLANATILNPTVNFTAGNTITARFDATIDAAATGAIDNTARGSGTGLPPLIGGGTGGGIPTDADATPVGSITQPQDTATGVEPTRVTVGTAPILGIAKEVSSPVSMTGASSFTVPYTLRFAVPVGSSTANNVQVIDDLAATYPGATITVGPRVIAGLNVGSTAVCTAAPLNAIYMNPASETNLLVDNSALSLAAGQGCSVAFTVTVVYPTPAALNVAVTKNNSATVSAANTPGGTPIVTDVSNNGTDPAPAGNTPTPVSFGSITGNVYRDNDYDGTFGAGDTNLPAIDVDVSRNGANPFTVVATTDGAGAWSAIVPISATDTYTVNVQDQDLPVALRSSATVGNLSTLGSDPQATVAAPATSGSSINTNGASNGDGYAPQSIGVAKRINTDGATRVSEGVYDIAYTVRVQNTAPTGGPAATNVQVVENFLRTFNPLVAADIALQGIPAISGTGGCVAASVANPGAVFTGEGANALLSGNTNLTPGQFCDIAMTVRVTLGAQRGPFNNTAFASTAVLSGAATSNPGTVVPNTGAVSDPVVAGVATADSDLSDDSAALVSDTDADREANEAGENDPTTISFGTISGRVFTDTAGNGADNGNVTDPGIANVDVIIDPAGATPAFTIQSTAPDGTWSTIIPVSSASTPATYLVNVDDSDPQLAGLTLTTAPSDGAGNNGETVSAPATASAAILSLNDGYLGQAIGVAKNITSTTQINANTIEVTYSIIVQNIGSVAATNVQVVENFLRTFSPLAAANIALQGTPTIGGTGTCVAASVANPGAVFTGEGANALLSGNTNLTPGQNCTISLTVQITNPTATTYNNTAYASTSSTPNVGLTVPNNPLTAPTPPVGTLVQDLSDAGTNPSTNNGSGGLDDPTPLTFGTITGTVFRDANGNGTREVGENGVGNVVDVVLTPSAGAAITVQANAATGDWTAIVPLNSGLTYNVNVDDADLPADLRTSPTTGNLSNGTDPQPGVAAPTTAVPNTLAGTDGYKAVADLAVDKVSSLGTYVQGAAVQYTVVVWNRGAATPISGVAFTDNVPANLTSLSWTCAPVANCSAASGSTQASLNALLLNNLATNASATPPVAGSFATVTINGTATTVGTGITNTATVTLPSSVTEATGVGTSPNSDDAVIAINSPSSLTLAKSVTDPDAPIGQASAGEILTYTITVQNTGGTATSVDITDVIPTNTTYVAASASNGGTFAANTVTWNAVAVGAGATVIRTFQVTVNSPLPANVTQVSNTALVDETGPNPPNSTPPAITPTVPDLVIAKTATPQPFIVGQTGTFNFTVTNQGGTATTGTITVSDPLPTGLTVNGGAAGVVTTTAPWTCNSNAAIPQVVTCTSTAAIAVGANSTFGFNVNVGATADAGTASPDSTNTATVQGGGEPVPSYNNNNTGSTPVNADPRADVTTVVNVPNTPTIPGSTITGTIDFRNAGPSPAAGVTSSITFPTGLTGGSIPTVTCTPVTVIPSAYNAGTGLVTLSGIPNPLPLSATPNYTCNISYVVPSNATADQVISSSIGTTTNQGANTLPDTSSVTVPLNSTDLQIVKVDNPASGTYTPGQAITYTVTVVNGGPDAVTGARVLDTNVTPANLTINTVTCAEGAGGATIGCPAAFTVADFTTGAGVTLGQLAASGADNTIIFTVNATVSAGATGALTNRAEVFVPVGFGDPTPGNNISTDTNNPTGSPVDLTIIKVGLTPPFIVGQTGNYRIAVSNAAGSVSTSGTITVTDTLPAGLTVATGPLTLSNVVPAAAWTCTGTAPSTISCTTSTVIAGGGSSSFDFPVAVGAPAAPSVNNTATVSGGGEPPINNGNNDGPSTTPVTPVADLSIIKDNSLAAVAAGSQVTYTVTVSNAGPNAVTGAIVSDPVVPNFNVTGVTCAETAGGATLGCPVAAITPATFASGVTLQQLAASGADSSVVFTVVGTVTGNTGNVNNVAQVLAPVPGAGIPVDSTDPTRTGAGNNTEPDNDPITPQIIGVAKTANILTSGVGLPTAPTYRVRYSVVLENTGTVNATNVQISENLERTYAGVALANINVVGGSVTATRGGAGTASGTECVANLAFTGKDAAPTFNSTNMTLLNGSGTLEPGERCTVQFDVDVLFPLTNNAFDNTAYGSTNANPNNPGTTVSDSGATSEPAGTLTTDLSDNGVSPTGNNGSGTPEDPTPIRLVRVTGNVFQDDNADGTNAANPDDLGINNVSVVLTSSGANPTSTTVSTDINGDWVAFVPAATYNVNVTDSTLPVGVFNGTNGNISTGTSDGVASAGESVVVAVPVNGTDPVATTPDGYGRVADLAVDKVSSAGTYVQGSAVQYTVVVWNRGAATPISGVSFTDNVPANITSLSWTCAPVANCSAASGANQASLNALLLNNLATNASATPPVAGSFATVTINGTATTAGAGINNTATIVAPIGVLEATGVGTSPNSDSASITINTPSDINQTKAVDAGADNLAQAGEILTYTISVTNNGGTATSVNITDNIPANTTYVAGSASNGGTFAANTVTWNAVNIPANNVATPVTRTFQVTVNTPLPANTTQISNVALVDDPLTPAPPNGTPPVITPTVPDLVIAKTATPQPFIVGQTGTFNFTVTNQGGTATTGTITVSDPLPTGLTVNGGAAGVVTTTAPWTCNSNAAIPQVVTCTSTSAIAIGANSVFGFNVNVGATADAGTASPDSTNTATVQGGGEPVPSYNNNNTGSTPVNADPRADLQITKTNGASSVAANGTTSYTVTVTNNGPSPVPAGAVVNDPAVAGLTKTSVTCVGTACPVAPILVSSFEAGVNLGALANGATAVFTVNANVTAIAGSVTNVANIVSSPVVDTDVINNTASDTDPITAQQIGVAKAITSTTQVNPNTLDVTYSIIVQNTGTVTATNVQVVENFLRTFSPLTTADIAVQGTPTIGGTGTCVAASLANPGAVFNGEGNNALLAGNTNLAVGENCTISLTVRVSNLTATTYNNTAYGSTSSNPNVGVNVPNDPTIVPTNPVGTITTDESDAGTSPTGNNGGGGTNDPTPLALGSITGTVFGDTNGNGTQDGTEAGVGTAIPVVITPSVGTPITAQTDPTTGVWTAIVPLNSGLTYGVNVTDSSLPAELRTDVSTGNLTTPLSDPETGILAPTTATPNRSSTNDGYARVADVRVLKTVSPSVVTVGNPVSYTITVWNGGPAVANNIAISDSIPAGVTLNTWTCTASGTANCDTASGANQASLNALTVDVPVNASVAAPTTGSFVTITINGTANAAGSPSNLARVTVPPVGSPDFVRDPVTNGTGPNPSRENESSVPVTINTPSSINQTKSVDAGADNLAQAGETLTYTISVTNSGGTATSVNITDSIPANTTYVTGSASNGGTFAAGTVTWNAVNIPANTTVGAPITRTFQVTVNTPIPANTTQISNVALVDDPSDPNPPNPTPPVTTPTVPDLVIAKTDNAATFVVGLPGTYELTVTNQGGTTTGANTITVTDTLPSGLTRADGVFTPNGTNGANWNCTAAANVITCTSSTPILPAGSSVLSFQVIPTNAALPSVSNTVSVQGGGEPVPNYNGNNTATEPTPVVAQQIGVVKAAPASVNPVVGNPLAFDIPYAIQVTNLSAVTTATNVQIVDDLTAANAYPAPAVVTIISPAVVSSGGCTINPTAYNGTTQTALLAGSDTLAANTSCIVKFTARVTYPNVGAIPTTNRENRAVASTSATPNPNGTNPPIVTDTSTPTTPNGGGDPTTPPTTGDTPNPTPTRLNQPPVTQDRTNDPIVLTANATVLNVTPSVGSPNLLGTDPDGTVTGYRITSLPSNGTLALGGTPVAIGDIIPVASLGTLTFDPDGTAPVSGSTSFNYAAIDNNNLEDGTPNTYSIPLGNTPPTTDDHTNVPVNTGGVNAPLALSPVAPTLTGADSDGTVASFVVTTLPSSGTLLYNGNPVVAGTTVIPNTAADLALVTYTPSTIQPAGNSVAFQYAARDNNGLQDGSPATFTIPYTVQTIDAVKSAGAPTVISPTSYSVPFNIKVGNSSTVPATKVQVIENLSRTFPTATSIVVSSFNIAPVGGATCSAPTATFNGTGNNALLAGSDTLTQGQSCTITFTVTVGFASVADATTVRQNQVYASTTAQPGNNPGHTVPNDPAQPVVPPVNSLATDSSTNSPTLPGTPNTDPPSPTPITPITIGSISGLVFEDRNSNGTRDPGEPGIGNVPVTVTPSIGAPIVVNTNPDGTYSVANLPLGNTQVSVTDPANSRLTTANDPQSVVIVPGNSPVEDVGFVFLGNVRGNVFVDSNGNGSQAGVTETGFAAQVRLTNGNFTVTVPADPITGVYTADNVPVGTVTVEVLNSSIPATLQTAGVPNQTAGVNPSAVTVTTANTPANRADAGADGYQPNPPVAVNDSTTTIADTNVDIPVLTNDSSTIPNTKDPTSVIFTPTGQPAGSTVSPNGKTLTVPNEGTYTISPSTGVVTFDPLPTFAGSTTPVQYTFADNGGLVSNPALISVSVGAPTKGTVTGLVWRDDNGDGIKQVTEPGIGNVDVLVTPATGAAVTVTTNPDGTWSAPGVNAGSATVKVQTTDTDFPTGATLTTTGSDPSTVTVVAGGTVADTQDGFRLPAPATLPNTANTPNNTPVTNLDILGNDTSSSPLTLNPSSVVFQGGGTITNGGKTLTNPQGVYTINPDGTVNFVPASPAIVGVLTPVQYTVADSSGNISAPTNITITVGAIGTGTIQGVVFFDDNGNGTRDGSEDGIPNVQVTATPVGGGAPINLVTNASGAYTALNVPAGNYLIQVVNTSLPANVKTGTTPNQTAGTNDPANPLNTTTVVGGAVAQADPDGYRLNPPVASNDSSTTPVNVPVTFSLTGNDNATNPANIVPSTVDLNPSLAGQQTTRTVPEGTFTVNGVGEVTFTPNLNFSGNVTPITYTVLDSTTQRSNAATVNVVVTPTAANDSATTPVNTPVTVPILANDVGSLIPSTVVFPTQPNGTVSNGGKKLTIPNEGVYDVNPDGTVTFTPVNGFIGTVKPVTYSVSDGVTTRTALIDNLIVAAQTGSLRGVVFQDLDGNGSQGATEPGIPNIDVVITNGSFTRTVVTDTNGVYTADAVPTGTVTVDVVTTDPQFPANVTQTAGVDPSVVTVAVTNTPASPANAGADGYRPAAPIAVNDSVTTPADTNVDIPVLTNDSSTTPSTKDPTSVVFTPTGQPTGSTVSPDGKIVTVPNEGTYTINPTTGVVTFDPLPAFTGSATPVQYTFKDSNGQPSNPAQIAVDVGAPNKGDVTGKVFEDTNGNGTQDAGELGIPNVQVTITPATGAPITVLTNATGDYTALNVPVGNATVDVLDSSIPAKYKNATGTPNQTAGTDPTNNVAVTAGGTTNAGIDGYRPNPPVANNDSRVAPDTSTPVNNIPVLGNDTSSNPLVPSSVVFPATGQPVGSTVTPNGKQITVPNKGIFTVNPDGTISFVPAPTFDGSMPEPVKYTVQDTTGQTSNPANLAVTAPGNPAFANIIGKVYRDDNGNSTQDGSEPGLENIAVRVTNTAGFDVTVQTAADGTYSVANLPLGSPVTVTVVESSIPSGLKTGTTPNQTEGTNPTQIATPVAGTNNAGNDGYRLNPPVARPDSAVTPLNTPITFSLTGNDAATNPANVAPDTIDLDPSTPARETTRTVPNQGTFTVNGVGEVNFVPANNFSGNVTPITYTVLDSTGQKSNVTTVNVLVLPTAANDTASTPVNTPVTVPVLTNDGGSLVPASVVFPSTGQPVGSSITNGGKKLTIPGEGVYDVNPNGTITFTPENGFTGAVKPVRYSVNDGVTTREATIDMTVTAQTGSLRGVVFYDLDGNGSQGATEPGIPNVDVVITNGSFTTTVTTNANGVYTRDNVPTGTVTVNVVNTDPDFPANVTQTAGVDPSVVTVAVTNTPTAPANAGADGYRPAAPVATNDTATVPAGATSVNIPVLDNDTSTAPSTKDPTSVVFTPTGQLTGSTVSPDGKTLVVPNEGTYTINPTTGVVTFTPVPTFTGSATPVQYTFEDSNGQPSNPAQIAVTVGTPNKGSITGTVFEDTNGNGALDAGELRLEGVQVQITPNGGAPVTVVTNASGVYTALNLPTGNAVVNVVDSSISAKYKNATGTPNQTAGTDPTNNVAVTAGGITNAGIDGYRPNPPVANPDNRTAPDTSTPINNIPVLNNDTSSNPLVPSSVVFPTTGQPTGSTVTPDGKQITVPNVGTYTVNPDGTINFVPAPTFTGNPVTVKYTVQDTTGQTSQPTDLTISAPGNPALATVIGKVYRDDNGNNTQDGSEPGLENISVTVTNGTFTATVQTAPNGTYSVPNVPITSPITVTVDNATIPATLKTGNVPNQTEGTNPTQIATPVAGTNNAGNDGYRLNPPVARPDSAVTPLNTPITFSLTGNDTATNPANVAPDTIDLDPSTPARETTRTVPEGTFTVNGIGEVTFVPSNNFSGVVTPISYTVLDSTTQKSNVAAVNVTVLPRANNDTAATSQETPVTVNVLNNDAGSLVPSSVVFPNTGQPVGSSVSNGGKKLTVPGEGVYDINPNGTITFTPATGYFGTTKPVTYQVNDGTTPVTATLTVNVSEVQTARVEVPVFNDLDGDGVRDSNETPIVGATVTLYEVVPDPANPGKFIVKKDPTTGLPIRLIDPSTNQPYPPVVTGPNGIAVFPNVKVGQVGIVVTDPSGKVLTTGNNIQVINVLPNRVNTTPAVGYIPPVINLTITPDRQVVTPGDNLPYTSVIINNTPGSLTPLKYPQYTVTLPTGVKFDPSKPVTVTVGNQTVTINPTGTTLRPNPITGVLEPVPNIRVDPVTNQLIIQLPTDLKNGEPVTVKFDTIVAPNVDPSKQLIAVGTVTGIAQNPSLTGVPVSVNASSGAIAAAAVKINLGVFDNKSVILGRVYFDANNNNNYDPATTVLFSKTQTSDYPLAGARVYFSDGRSAVTDKNGLYNLPNVTPGTYAIRLDPVTAPYTVKRVPEDQGSAGTRHVRVGEVGGIIYADFALVPPSGAAVKARSTTVQRGPVTLQKSMVQGGAGYAVTIKVTVTKAVNNLVITDPLPSNTTRGPITINGTTVTPVISGNSITIPGTVAAGTYTIVYALFSPLPPDLALTDPDISYEEIFVLIPLKLEPEATAPELEKTQLSLSLSAPTPTADKAVEVDSEISRKFGDEVIQ